MMRINNIPQLFVRWGESFVMKYIIYNSGCNSLRNISYNILNLIILNCPSLFWYTLTLMVDFFSLSPFIWILTLIFIFTLIVIFQLCLLKNTSIINYIYLYRMVVRLIIGTMNRFVYHQSSFIKNSKSMSRSGISYKYAFISFSVKFPKIILLVIKEETFASEDM